MFKHLSILVLYLFCGLSLAETISDRNLRISIDVPAKTKVERAENERGQYVSLIIEDLERKEVFTLQAVRANNGGFGEPIPSVVEKIVIGASRKIGREPVGPTRTFLYQGKKMYVSSHIGLGVDGTQTLTSVYSLDEQPTWRRILTLQFLPVGSVALMDKEIIERLESRRLNF